MERLTMRIADTVGMTLEHEEMHTMDEWVDMLQTRLCEYEDTGLTPDEISTMANDIETRFYNYIAKKCGNQAGEVAKILQAAIEGRVLVLPCPIGTPVFVHERLCVVGKQVTYEGCKYSQDCTHMWGLPCPLRVAKRAFTVNMRNGLGKTFWPTQEEAEAAIPEGRREKHG